MDRPDVFRGGSTQVAVLRDLRREDACRWAIAASDAWAGVLLDAEADACPEGRWRPVSVGK